MVDGYEHEKGTNFTFLGIIVLQTRAGRGGGGGGDSDEKVRIDRARVAFLQMKIICVPSELTINTKIRISDTTKKFLLHGAGLLITPVTTRKSIQGVTNALQES